jgi:hypothetical protein
LHAGALNGSAGEVPQVLIAKHWQYSAAVIVEAENQLLS